MKTVLVGAVESSQVALNSMCASDMAPALLVTLPPDLAHRHADFVDLAPMAHEHGIAVHYTERSDSQSCIDAIQAVDPDLVLVIGWSQLCGPTFRAVPRLGCIGFHPSALPRLRGRGVIPWTILLGERQVGASLFWLGEGADTGPIAAQKLFEVDPDTVTARELYDRHKLVLAELLPELLARMAAGEVPAEPQPEDGATTCARRRPEDGEIDWHAPAAEVHRLIRAVGPPYAGAFTHQRNGAKLVFTGVRHTSLKNYYIGLPGQVQAVEDTHFTVACGDGRCIDIIEWSGPDMPPALHSKLGTAPDAH